MTAVKEELTKLLDDYSQKIRNKAIDDYFNELCKSSESVRPVGWTERYSVVTIDRAMDIANELKGRCEL